MRKSANTLTKLNPKKMSNPKLVRADILLLNAINKKGGELIGASELYKSSDNVSGWDIEMKFFDAIIVKKFISREFLEDMIWAPHVCIGGNGIEIAKAMADQFVYYCFNDDPWCQKMYDAYHENPNKDDWSWYIKLVEEYKKSLEQ